MAVLKLILVLGLFNLANAQYGVELSADPKSLSILVETNVTFTAKLTRVKIINEDRKHLVILNAQSEDVILNPVELDFFLEENETSSEKEVELTSFRGGFTEINTTDASEIDNAGKVILKLRVFNYEELRWVEQVVGWIYFVAWSFSFYPQTYSNYKRKSVVGFNLDYVALNFVGHTCYCIFNVGLKYFTYFQTKYFSKNEHGVNPVQINDVLFSSHAVFATIVHIIQCIIYERGNQKVSITCWVLLSLSGVVVIVGLILAIADVTDYLDFLYLFSYIKLSITFLKYCPQAYQNWKNQSTKGWSIGYVVLDVIGGLNSLFQMVVIAYNFDDWGSISGDMGKLGLGVISVLFDFLFMFQHYILYNTKRTKAKSNVSQAGLVLDGVHTHM